MANNMKDPICCCDCQFTREEDPCDPCTPSIQIEMCPSIPPPEVSCSFPGSGSDTYSQPRRKMEGLGAGIGIRGSMFRSHVRVKDDTPRSTNMRLNFSNGKVKPAPKPVSLGRHRRGKSKDELLLGSKSKLTAKSKNKLKSSDQKTTKKSTTTIKKSKSKSVRKSRSKSIKTSKSKSISRSKSKSIRKSKSRSISKSKSKSIRKSKSKSISKSKSKSISKSKSKSISKSKSESISKSKSKAVKTSRSKSTKNLKKPFNRSRAIVKKNVKKSKSPKSNKPNKSGKSKSKSGSSKSKSTSRSSKSSKSSKSKTPSKGRKKTKSPKRGQKKKPRGRSKSKRRSGRKPRGPPPTPVIVDLRKAQMQAIERQEKFNKFRLEQRLEQITVVDELRGYCSEPDITTPCNRKFEFKSPQPKLPTWATSAEDVTFKSYDNLLKDCPYDEDDFKELIISPDTWKKWYELFEMEKQRYSFYDELYAKKYVTDSMELPRYNEDISYLLDADDCHYRMKIDYGRVVMKTKHIYTGNFNDWYFQGPGRYVWLDGGVYQGDFVNGVMHGQGTFLWPDGSIYDGEFQDGVRKGWGIYTTNDGYMFTGEWVDGAPTGSGKIWYDPANNPSNCYDGDLICGCPTGFGTRHYANGDIYIGTWLDGQRDGQGTMLWQEQNEMYKGDWAQGAPHGRGIQVWYLPTPTAPPKKNSKKLTRYIYKGSWEHGSRHGKGTMFFADGSVYEGHWSKGRQLQDGVYIDPLGEFLLGLSCIQPDEAGFMDDEFNPAIFDCIFEKLVKSLSAIIPIKSSDPEMSEDRLLTIICSKYLPELRLLYQRTVDLGILWSNATLENKVICKNSKKCFSDRNGCQTNFQNIFSKLNELSASGVNPPTLFGLWLFVKDIENSTRHVTMAHYDKCWRSHPSICFEGRNSPFEVVYFWQFIQCLVVVAFEMYAGIPFEQSKTKYKCNLNKLSAFADKEEKIINWGNARKGTGSSSAVKKELSNDDFMDMPKEDDGAVGRPPSTLFESDEQTETDDVDLVQAESSESDIFGREDRNCAPISISEIFDLFINENLFKCFDRIAGSLLPPLPNPLPPLNDLYQAFKSIKTKESITAIDFLHNILHNQVYPECEIPAIYWTRTKQILSPEINILKYPFSSKGNSLKSNDDNKEKKSSDSQQTLIIKPDVRSSLKVGPHKNPEYKNIPNGLLCRTILDNDNDNDKSSTEGKPNIRVLEERIHDVELELLVPDGNPPERVINFTKDLQNLNSDDVIGVLCDLYPELCGPAREACLDFNMIFCDWFWGVILCSNVSIAKDQARANKCRKASKLRMPFTIVNAQKGSIPICSCCTSNRRANNRKFYSTEILSVFMKHQEIRKGEMQASAIDTANRPRVSEKAPRGVPAFIPINIEE